MKKIFLLTILSVFVLACSSTKKVQKTKDVEIKKVQTETKDVDIKKVQTETKDITTGTGFRGYGTGSGVGGTGTIVHVSGTNKEKYEPRKTKLKTGNSNFTGHCEKSDIQRVVSRKSRTIRYCYSKELLTNANIAGRVKIMWIIKEDGTVGDVEIIEDTINNEHMANCIKRQIKKWKFSEPVGGECKIVYPFIFSSKE